MTYNQPIPTRISITVPFHVFTALRDRADGEGRSTSNLAAFLLEVGLSPNEKRPAHSRPDG